MNVPDPLPQLGAWLVMADGSVYEMIHCRADGYPPCTLSAPTDAGAYYWSVDEGEPIWTPWADVEAVGTYDEADAIAADIAQRDADKLNAGNRPRVAIAHTTRWSVTIYHAPGETPPAYLRDAVRAVIQAALRAAGIDDAAVLITEEA